MTQTGQSKPFPGITHTGIAVTFFCHDGNGHFLMGLRGPGCRDEHHRWDIGSGAVEFGDSPEKTACREIDEEYGLAVQPEQLALLGIRSVERGQSHWIAIDYMVDVGVEAYQDDLAINGEPHKLLAVDWFTWDTLPESIHSQLPYYVFRYQNQIGCPAPSLNV